MRISQYRLLAELLRTLLDDGGAMIDLGIMASASRFSQKNFYLKILA
jgi:hypothetical protein